MNLQESGQMYLETIYVLSKKGDGVRSLDVASQMNYSKPSVSRAIGILRKSGYLTVDESGYLHLTPAGESVASKIYERHTLLTELFIRLGVDPDIAASDACKLEHGISDESFEAIKRHVRRYEGKTGE
ncbi:MAG TPA: metal-dependent transcriptional regulator [Candidatus Faeciplasma pullistercoris]|uniref:Metal-dependent transcriptional regulator n=1 Tax=Candidatus Faeciplasma pullistercoris TaxID=2840800 RepID=A0A9D1KKN3_9FIRM|nr:metal-dependent transcriptional regulator [Candidatus Faeciplasma pullistercoris]